MARSTTSLNGRGPVVVEKELITDPALVENELVVDTDTTEEINHQKTFVLTPEQKEVPVEEPQGDTEQLFEQPKNKQKRKLFKALILAGLGAIAIASGTAGYNWWQYASVHESTEDAYIRGNIHPVSSRINGTVASVLVDDNQQVKKGQLLVKLDPSDYQVQAQQSQAALEAAQRQANAAQSNINYASKNAQGNITQAQGNISNAQAAVATVQAAVKEAQAGIPAAQAQVAQANANLQNLEVDYKRYRNLYQSGAIARQQLDSARTAYQVAVAEKNTALQGVAQAEAKLAQAQQSVAEAQAKLAASKGGLVQAQAGTAQTEVNRSQYQAAKAAIAQAQAQLNNSKLQLSYTNIVASSTGRIGNKSVEVGQRVQPGTPLMAIVDNNNWVVANFKETQLAKMHPGQQVEVDIDAIPQHHFTGHVQSFSPGSGATFALLPPDNATGNFTKIVQRIPVKIVLDPQSVKGYESRITPGMSVVATVDVSK